MHCGAEVTESSTNKQHHLSLSLWYFILVAVFPSNVGIRKASHVTIYDLRLVYSR
jgi:hypothetical protein